MGGSSQLARSRLEQVVDAGDWNQRAFKVAFLLVPRFSRMSE